MENSARDDDAGDVFDDMETLPRRRRRWSGSATGVSPWHHLEVLTAAATGELRAAREKLAQRNQQLDEKEEELATARQQLAQRNHELDEKNEELKALRLKLQEMETRNYQAEQLDGNAADPGPSQVQTTRRQTRSMQQKKRKFGGHCASKDDNLEVLREKLIKGFMELAGPCNLGVKEIGKLNQKAFQAACAAKLPPKEAEVIVY
ncbi:uncharacterized protein [Miscanthus floridulus]|uniref:uncharacterized protein n=1 Tax=Miscanthus floridulus TaxID=154761 RepID=UPI003457546C